MASITKFCCILVCSVIAFTLGSGEEPSGPSVAYPGDGEQPPLPPTNRPVNPPSIRPETTSATPTKESRPFFGRFGMRCPHATSWEEYRMNCAMYIDEHCGCVYDDMHVDQVTCVLNNRTRYEDMVQSQLELEEERDRKRVRDGLASSGERYFQVVDCLLAIPRIVERGRRSEQ